MEQKKKNEKDVLVVRDEKTGEIFFRNFYRQCKEPTRFGFYRVAAEAVDTLLPVIKDFLKDPVANAEILSAHKVDTSEYRKQAETENVKQESDNEPLKKTEEKKKNRNRKCNSLKRLKRKMSSNRRNRRSRT